VNLFTRPAPSRALISAMLLATLLTACDQNKDPNATADTDAQPTATLLNNGRIYTQNPAKPWAEAIVIDAGKYLYVGDTAGAQAYVKKSTRRIDLDGTMVMPGINDGHAHPWQGGIKTLYHCGFPFSATPDEIADSLRACIVKNPDSTWLTGGQWTSDFFRLNDIPSPRAWLDAIATDRAIFLHDDATHNGWVNSNALQLAGITRDTPDPEGGTIVRDSDGEPNGLLYEQARTAVLEHQPKWTTENYTLAIREALRQANSHGLTGVNEARVQIPMLDAYQQLDRAGELTAHVSVNHQTPREYRDYPLDGESYRALHQRYQLEHVNTGYVKIFLDGVPTASRSALMLEEYVTDAAHPDPTRGFLLVDPEVLTQDLIALDKIGMTVKIHAAGDGSVRIALDALQSVRETNGDSGLRHELAHAGFIDPVDVPRFAELGVTADLSPYIWYPSPIIDSIVGAIGERGLNYFPVKDLLDSGANVLMGSDWPSAAKDLSPWHAIEALITRRNPFTDGEETLWLEQAISLEQALAIATLSGARALRLDHITGSIEVGKSADFIVLDRNLFAIPPESISDTVVEQTWFAGSLVYPYPAPDT
jgi:predicted amidohydrolase YtcJ